MNIYTRLIKPGLLRYSYNQQRVLGIQSILPWDQMLQRMPINQAKMEQLSERQQRDFLTLVNYNQTNTNLEAKINLIFYLVQRVTPSTEPFIHQITGYILDNKINNNSEIERALKFLRKQASLGYNASNLDWSRFEQDFFTPQDEEELKFEIQSMLTQDPLSYADQNHCKYTLRCLQDRFPSVPSRDLFNIFSYLRNQICGRQQQEQLKPTTATREEIYEKIRKFNARDMSSALNTTALVEEHIKVTGGKVQLRFPPEPNGYLHLGHVRSIWLNFYSAKMLGGVCYLRYDDTNPTSERQDYIDQIRDNVQWFGYVPSHITYASDYFDRLHNFAVQLITQGKAYVCEQSKQEMQEHRQNKLPSPHRNRPIQESLTLFEEMKQGKHSETRYTLRLKIDHAHSNPTLRDPVVYRVKFHPHPRTGDKWKIYPMYDFAHCICDSLENITHSLCTLEFEIRRELYYWILENLNLFRPLVYEFSRLNVSNNLLSKRKIQKLVELGKVRGWDDPRLLTLAGLRRRGYTPHSILQFIELVNVSRSGNENIIQVAQLEHCARKELEERAPRIMGVLDPLELELVMDDQLRGSKIKILLNQKDLSNDSFREVFVDNVIYIERSDFKLKDEKDYFGLAPNKEVSLKYFASIYCTGYETDQSGNITKVKAHVVTTDPTQRKKNKGQLHWISKSDSVECQVNEYSQLFDIENPAEVEDFLEHVKNDSLKVMKARIPRLFDYTRHPRLQFERLGYYFLDQDSQVSEGKLIFNKIVGLKDKDKMKCRK